MNERQHTCSVVPKECGHLINSQWQRHLVHGHMLPIDLSRKNTV